MQHETGRTRSEAERDWMQSEFQFVEFLQHELRNFPEILYLFVGYAGSGSLMDQLVTKIAIVSDLLLFFHVSVLSFACGYFFISVCTVCRVRKIVSS